MKKIVARVFTLLFLLTFVTEVVTFVSSEDSTLDLSDRLASRVESPLIFSALFEESEVAEEENNDSKEKTELIFSELFDFSINYFKEETRVQEKIYRLAMLCRIQQPEVFKRTHALLI
ncbi:MAG: hypothetical protein FJZ78_09060 [Bacteroidetes bacterium]|nr:hypothetical protein [Bacteroidota bacterium]